MCGLIVLALIAFVIIKLLPILLVGMGVLILLWNDILEILKAL
jgi:hypothetical protein